MKKGIYLVQIYDDQYWVYACWDGEYFYMFGDDEPREVDEFMTVGKYLGKAVIQN